MIKHGWMDSTDFEWELGEAFGHCKIYRTKKELKEANTHVGRKEEDTGRIECFAIRVAVTEAPIRRKR